VSLFIAMFAVQVRAAEPTRVPVDFNRIQGVLSVVWGDPAPWDSREDANKFFLLADDHSTTEIFLTEDLVRTAGGVDRLSGRRVELVVGPDRGVGEDHFLKRKPIVHSIRVLSNGTPPKAAAVIMYDGIKPMGRKVAHHSTDLDTARVVGKRRCSHPTIFKVNAKEAHEAGVRFYLGNEDIWMSDAIPPEYLSVEE
jgi:hypothetical protein